MYGSPQDFMYHEVPKRTNLPSYSIKIRVELSRNVGKHRAKSSSENLRGAQDEKAKLNKEYLLG